MKVVSDVLKNTLKQPTTQRKGRILVNGNYYEVYNVEYYADVYNDGNVIGNAIASQLDFDLPYMAKFDSFKYFDGVWTGRDYEFVDMGTFTVVDEKDEDEFNKHITSFDNLIKFNALFEDKKNYPKTLFQELQNISSQAGVELVNTSIVNGSFIVENNQFVAGENLKTVLKNICGVSGTYATIKNDKLILQLQNKTDEVMNKGQHEPIEWKRKTYGINQVVLGLKDVGGEYVVKQDDEDITKNGVHKLVINDNYFAYTQEKRQQLINGLFEQVKGFGYVPYELKGEWLNYMDVGDTITIDGIETIVLRINGKSPKGLESIMSSPAIIDSAIEYVDNTNTLANQQKRTELLVDKELGEIRGEVSKVETTVQDITTTTQTSIGGNSLYIKDALESNALEYHVEGKSEQETRSEKNLLDVSNTTTSQGITSTINNNGSLTVSGTPTSEWADIINRHNKEIPAGTYTFSTVDVKEYPITIRFYYEDNTYDNYYLQAGSKNTQITLSKKAVSYYMYIWNLKTDTTYNDTLYLQLEKGTTQTEWEQYGASPSPDYPSEIKTIPSIRNLLPNKATTITTNGITFNVNDNGSVTINGTSTAKATLILDTTERTLKAGTYTLSISNNNINGLGIGTQIDSTYYSTNINKQIILSNESTFKKWYIDIDSGKTIDNVTVYPMLEEGLVAHEYVPYGAWAKVKVTGKNLFDKSTIITGKYIDGNGNLVNDNNNFTGAFILIDNSKQYYISSDTGNTKRIAYYDNSKTFISRQLITSTSGTLTIPSNTRYIKLSCYNKDLDTLQLEEVTEKNSEATEYEDYKEKEVLIDLQDNELCSIGNIKDELSIINGQVVIDKKIGKIVLNGVSYKAESKSGQTNNMFNIAPLVNIKEPKNNSGIVPIISTHFSNKNSADTLYSNANLIGIAGKVGSRIAIAFGVDSGINSIDLADEWLKTNNPIVYYELETPQQIPLPNTNIELFEGVNHITLVDDLETTTSIKYYRNTPIAQDYVVQQQIDKTNDNLANTTNKTNQNESDINLTNTNLNNNYYTKPQIDVINSATSQEITTIKKEVETKVTVEDLTIAINQVKTTSASSVETSTGYKFNENGLSIKKSDSEMSSLLDNDGLVVKRDTTEVLTVRSSGVQTENLTVRTYFTIGDNTRAENYKGGTGFFYIGGDN